MAFASRIKNLSWTRVCRRLRSIRDAAIARLVARPLQICKADWMLEYRPDSHRFHYPIENYHDLFQAWTHRGTTNNAGDMARFYMLQMNIEQVLRQDVEGDVAELGVYKGNSAFMMAQIARRFGRHVYLFDTFSGFDERDFMCEDKNRTPKHFSDTSLSAVRALVGEDSVSYIKGYFPESLSIMQPSGALAVVHLDCDLYEPAHAALEYFYPRLSKGGIMILHDYSSGEWTGIQRAADEFLCDKPERLVLIPDKSGSAVLRKHL